MPPACLGRCLAGPLKLLFRGSLPRVKGSFEAEELQEPQAARIVRDKAGVPHITAATEFDLFFLNGVVHGQDRLWQLHSARFLAAGRLSEFAGARALDLDRLARQLGFRSLAEGDLEALRRDTTPEGARALCMLEAFTRGVNWAVAKATRGGQLPAEFRLTGQRAWEPWQAVDTLSLARLYGFVMNFGFQHCLLRQGLISLFGAERAAAWTCTSEEEESIPYTVDEAAWQAFRAADLSGALGAAAETLPRDQGSNWWAIHGSRTASGKPILVGDPHLTIKIPTFWYEVHLSQAPSGASSSGLQAYGVAPPGVPGILIGQNGFAAWSVTLGYCDVEDIFLERVRRSDGKYLHCNEWKECEVREETILVKGAPPVQCACRSTCHGVLLEGKTLLQLDPLKEASAAKVASGLLDAEGEDVLPAFAGISRRPESLALVGLSEVLRARSFAAFDAGLAYLSTLLNLNIGYADIEGHIGYSLIGEVPVRGQPGDELLPLIGWTGEHDWRGFVKHSEMPKVFDPPEGFIISANHKVIDSRYYPNYLGQTWKSGYRAQAIRYELQQLFEGGATVSPEQMPAVLMNVRSWAAVDFVQELREVRPAEDTVAALQLLTSWNGELRADSVPAALYQLCHAELVLLLLDKGCEAMSASPSDEAWAGLDREALGRLVGGEGFDPSGMVKIVNELQGHLHLNVLRILRSGRLSSLSPADAGRRWWLEQAGGRDAAVNHALRAACGRLRRMAGEGWQTSPQASWGRLHTCHFVHPVTKNLGLPPGSPPFDRPSVESGGDTNTVMQAAVKSLTDFTATSSNVSLRVIFDLADLGDPGTNRIIAPLGQSGQFGSPHYGDQTKMWASGALRPIVTREDSVLARAVATMTFSKAKQQANGSSNRSVSPE